MMMLFGEGIISRSLRGEDASVGSGPRHSFPEFSGISSKGRTSVGCCACAGS